MSDASSRPFSYVPRWLRLAGRASQWLGLGALLALVALAYRAGFLANLALALLMLGVVVVAGERIFGLVNKGYRWPDTTSRVLRVAARVTFWALVGVVCWIGLIPEQLEPSDRYLVTIVPFALAGVLILMSLPARVWPNWPFTAFASVASAALFVVVALSLRGAPQDAIAVRFPFEVETLAIQAGPTTLTNYHVAHRGQRHAIDMEPISPNGTLMPGDPLSGSPCFGASLVAVADGTVREAVDDQPDVEVGQRTDAHPAGNRVILQIAPNRYAMYGHMKSGSIVVEEGQGVREGQRLGACGNSGNSTGPHLHFQIQDGIDLFDENTRTYPVRFRNTERRRGSEWSAPGTYDLRRGDWMRPAD